MINNPSTSKSDGTLLFALYPPSGHGCLLGGGRIVGAVLFDGHVGSHSQLFLVHHFTEIASL